MFGASLAQASLNGPTEIDLGNARVGESLNTTLSLSNTATAPAENLDASIGGTTGAAVASGSITGLASGATNSTHIIVGIDTATAGAKSGSVSLDLASNGTGIDDNGITPLASESVQVTGAVYREAEALIAPLPSSLIFHVGDAVSEALSVSNSAVNDGYSENLTASVAGVTGDISADGSTGMIAAQGASTDIDFGFSTTTAGLISGTVTLALASDGTGVDGLGSISLGQQTIVVNAVVNNYAKATFEEISGGGTFTRDENNYVLTLNVGPNPSAATFNLGVLNDVSGPSDLLSGSFATSGSSYFTLSGFGEFSGLSAGQMNTAPTVTFSGTSPGSYIETITLRSMGSNASGYFGALSDEILSLTVNVGQTYALTTKIEVVTGDVGNNVLVATNGTLNANDQIDGGATASNTLALRGAGTFDLRAPATLENISIITAQEGQWGYKSTDGTVNIASQRQAVYLRDGLDTVVNVASTEPNAANPNTTGITIYGADNSAVINLGSGNDTVYLGGANETVNGGGGNNTFYVDATTIGATINGGSGTNTLNVTGGGNVAMGANVAGIDVVNLKNAPTGQTQTDYNFTANNAANLVINGSTSGDTITVGDVSQTVNGSTGDDRIIVDATTAGALVRGSTGADTLEIRGGGTAVLNAGDSGIEVVQLDVATNLVMNNQKGISVQGSDGDDSISVLGSTLTAASSIAGGEGTDALVASGAGTFDLRAPAALTGIEIINAKEGQYGYKSADGTVNIVSQRQTVYLRDGLDAVVNVASADVNAANPNTAGITIYGANNSTVINLSTGNDTVYLGGANETVNGGGGNNTFYADAITIGATINGGSSTNTLNVTGGGSVVMGSNVTGISVVNLRNAPTGQTQADYNFTANNTANLVINGSSSGDTVTVGDVSQTVNGSTGDDRIIVDATTVGALVRGSTGTDTLEIRGGGTAVLNAGASGIEVVQLDVATDVAINVQSGVSVEGSDGDDTIRVRGSTLTSASNIDGAEGIDVLVANGAGTFDLRAPTALTGIEVINVKEGQWGYKSTDGTVNIASQRQTVYLRDGLDAVVNVASTESTSANPNTTGITIYGANNSAVINLGSGNDTVYLGGANETVNGGGGNNTFYATAAASGALINGGIGKNTLTITDGGIAVLNASNSGINSITLKAATSLTLDNENGVIVRGSTENDTFITGSGSNVTLNGAGGYDTYEIGVDSGSLTINNAISGGAAASGEIDFLSGLNEENLWFKRSGSNLEIDVLGTSEKITISNWYGSNASAKVTSFETADGLMLDSQVAQLVSAMASYAANNNGFDPTTATVMPMDATLQSAVAAAWHS